MGRKKSFNCTVQVAGLDSDYECPIDKTTKGDHLFDQVCDHIGLAEKEYFGLRYIDEKDGQFNWLEGDRSIKRQMGKAPLHFYFAVKFYPENPTTLREDITRYQFVLQLREDLLKGRIQCSNPIHALLASYVMQAELGDLHPEEHEVAYLSDLKFFPKQPPELRQKIEAFHRKHVGMTPSDAEFQYLDNVRKLPLYGRDMYQAWGDEGQAVTIAISAWGVEVFQNNRQMHRFVWPKIISIGFKSKKFSLTLRAPSEDDYYKSTTIYFKCGSKRAAKRVWKVCVEHHAFFRLKEPVPLPKNTNFFKIGSKFRYSGRTQHQARNNESVGVREQPSFDRVSSKRFSLRVLDSNRKSMLIDDDAKKEPKSPEHPVTPVEPAQEEKKEDEKPVTDTQEPDQTQKDEQAAPPSQQQAEPEAVETHLSSEALIDHEDKANSSSSATCSIQ
ncbi:band 4.1-like protein 1 isoform X2 [Nematostella vectensis]|uniref:band 4.1-like protein 1 isoform X2 n=1 Tax=Nematostella vectensis TaxID=45351 RepID=UPI0020774761|nr:band 4.1-like protein 1 isoform X2 [Nematostella vectensis]